MGFRVIAVNKAGRSEASHASRPKVAKETDLMPFVDARNMADVTAEAKERVKLDVGTYTIVARNKSGEDSASGRIKVLDRPAAPEAPMKISIEDGDATLFWKPSKSDGGCTIEHYQLEKKD